MPFYRVEYVRTLTCSKVVEAQNEQEALKQTSDRDFVDSEVDNECTEITGASLLNVADIKKDTKWARELLSEALDLSEEGNLGKAKIKLQDAGLLYPASKKIQNLLKKMEATEEKREEDKRQQAEARFKKQIVARAKYRFEMRSGKAEKGMTSAVPDGMVLVEGGIFKMGNDRGEEDERPAHEVYVDSFYMDECPVTVGQYRSFCGTTGREWVGCGWQELVDNEPVTVKWEDAKAYAKWAGKRLPTEAEWEYAAKGGKKSQGFEYSGSNNADAVAWYKMNSGGKLHPVRQKRPNELGLYDMSGNVAEYCVDLYDRCYYVCSHTPQENPQGPVRGRRYVVRGGHWFNTAKELGISRRSYTDAHQGFRCVQDLEREKEVAEEIVSESETSQVPEGMVQVVGGIFWMGARGEENVVEDQQADHLVEVNSFHLDRYAVTVAQYREFCAATGRNMPDNPYKNWVWQDSHPMVQVTWEDAEAYAEWAGKRLPTEAEWEYAAREGENSRGFIYSGSNDPNEVAWYSENSGGELHPVGKKRPNSLGLFDMTGNVWEWCADWHDEYIQQRSPQKNPRGPQSGSVHVMRGGSYVTVDLEIRVFYRNILGERLTKSADVGFRCVKDL